MRRSAILVAAVLGALLLIPAAAPAATCGQINRVLDAPIPIPDIPQGEATSRIWIPPAGAVPPRLEDVDINVDLTHPTTADLDIAITHNGKTVNLSSDNGGGGSNYTRTVFDDEATPSIVGPAAPFTGSFKPEQPLSAFDDEEPGGVWTLRVRDDTGTLDPGGGGGTPPTQQINSWGIRWSANVCGSVRPPCDEVVYRVGVPLSDGGSNTSSTSVSGTGTVTRVEPRVTITHPRDSDLKMSLQRGSTTVDLADNRGGSGANFIRTLFSDSAATAISAGTAPFTGSFRPETPLNAFNGSSPSGNWSLTVADEVGGVTGTWDEWSLRIVLTTCTDPDDDAVWTAVDNCANAANPDQDNHDRFKDAAGDACDEDDDQDGRPDAADACPRSPVPPGPQTDPDTDADGCFDAEDADDDGDGVADAADGCPLQAVGADGDPDGDGCGNAIDTDDDGDGVTDPADACPAGAVGQGDDADGNGCKGSEDPDGDGIPEARDRCTTGTPGPGGDADGDGCKDVEDSDDDDDGVADATDNCASLANAKQEDLDADRQGDACDVDDDADGLVDAADACQRLAARTLSGCPAFARKASFKFTARSKLSGKLALSGRTRAPACLARQSVTLFRVKRGRDPAVGKPLATKTNGTFALRRKFARGKYYVTAKAATVGDVAECRAAKSKAVNRR